MWGALSTVLENFGWAAMAACGVIAAEVIYRRAHGEFPLLVIPVLLLNQPLLWKMYGAGPSLLVAVATFSACTAVGRMLVSQFILHEHLQRGNLVAAVLMGGAVVVGRMWR